MRDSVSPRITYLSWGHIEVEGRDNAFKNAKLYPGGAREWDWGETGTSHIPGIQPADVEELLENGASVVVLSRGMQGRLQVVAETVSMLEDRGVEAHVLPTDEGVEKYNELAEHVRVGGLFHSTC